MNYLVKKELVRGLQTFLKKDCVKIVKRVDLKVLSKAKKSNIKAFKLVHMDLFGPINVPLLDKKKYTFVIVDDYLRHTWVKFLALKDEAT